MLSDKVFRYSLGDPSIVLTSDLAAEFPLYLYLPDDKQILLYSKSITTLLNDRSVKKPLRPSNEGISFLLQSGVVPPPKTAYENIFILGIGDKAHVSTRDDNIHLQFSHQFPFMNANRLNADEMQPDEDLILQMVAEATISRIDATKPSFLFHSAGKDSNMIALALAEAGWQDRVTLITHKSKGDKDESEISAQIAKKLGFKHQILHEVDHLQDKHKQVIEEYFGQAPFPCVDNVSLAYPLYAYQLPELKDANIIDGMGNDVFIGHIPNKHEFRKAQLSKYACYLRKLGDMAGFESLLFAATRTRIEKVGFSGFSWCETKSLFHDSKNTETFWATKNFEFSSEDYLDVRSALRGTIIDQEIFLRKVRNFSGSFYSNLILPWCNEQVASYFSQIPETYLFDRQTLKNKLILRKMLKERIGLDSDVLGKFGFSYDKSAVITQNWPWVSDQIFNCSLWDNQGIRRVTNRLTKVAEGKGRKAAVASGLVNRLFLLSMWHINNKYLNSKSNEITL